MTKLPPTNLADKFRAALTAATTSGTVLACGILGLSGLEFHDIVSNATYFAPIVFLLASYTSVHTFNTTAQGYRVLREHAQENSDADADMEDVSAQLKPSQ